MSILVDDNTRLIVQGITGKSGKFHAEQCRDYGTKLIGGVTPGRKGREVHGVPVFDTFREAVAETMRLFLHGRPISYEKVHEVRSMIEVAVAGRFEIGVILAKGFRGLARNVDDGVGKICRPSRSGAAGTFGALAPVDVNQCEIRAGIDHVGWIHRSDHAQDHVQTADALGGLILYV